MAIKIFLTGGTGYIGGSLLDTLVTKRPQFEIAALLRNEPPQFSKKYPNVKVIKGGFDDFDIVADAASRANIVIQCGKSSHEGVIKAHIAGILRRDEPTFFIRLGGTGAIADWKDGPYGVLNPKVWSDIDDIDTLTSLPDWALHRPIEKLIQQTADANGEKFKSAIICSSGVYGEGKGLVRLRSLYMPDYYSEIMKLGAAFYTETGANSKGWVHMEDLMLVFLGLVDAAAAGGGKAVWGKEGYYFTASQETNQLQIAEAAGRILHAKGLIPTAEPRQLPVDRIGDMWLGGTWPYLGLYSFACNTRCRPHRARRYLDYTPKAPSVFDCMEDDLMACHTPDTR